MLLSQFRRDAGNQTGFRVGKVVGIRFAVLHQSVTDLVQCRSRAHTGELTGSVTAGIAGDGFVIVQVNRTFHSLHHVMSMEADYTTGAALPPLAAHQDRIACDLLTRESPIYSKILLQAGTAPTGLHFPGPQTLQDLSVMHFPGAHILSVTQFERTDVEKIFQTADAMQPYAHRERMTKVLDGAILGNMFFEPSTRTRVSFGCAFNLLGGEVRETTDIKASSLVKGESLYDTGRVMSGYSDVIVMRHPQAGSVAEFARASRVPVLNAGDGPNEHPSQALLDLYTIRKELKSRQQQIEGMKIAMIGDLKHGRTVHSLSQLVQLYPHVTFTLISPSELRMPGDIVE